MRARIIDNARRSHIDAALGVAALWTLSAVSVAGVAWGLCKLLSILAPGDRLDVYLGHMCRVALWSGAVPKTGAEVIPLDI